VLPTKRIAHVGTAGAGLEKPKSREDVKGKDRIVIEVFYPSGSYRKRLFNIDVR
jgi:hypothetical protein